MSIDTAAEDVATTDVLMEITPAALEMVLGIRAEEPDPAALGLRIEIAGVRGVDFVYDLSFEELDSLDEGDLVTPLAEELSLVVPADSVDRLRGATLDVPRHADQSGLVIRNPNRPNPLAGVDLHLEGTVAERVAQLLEQTINPSLGVHGGFATLVGVDDDRKVYVTMGGGCHGCAMSRLTVTQGIEQTIRGAIPEVTEVIDATDHSTGENPFYT